MQAVTGQVQTAAPQGPAGQQKTSWQTWHSDADIKERRQVVEKILHLFQKKKPQVTLEWQQKLPDFVKRLEEALYRQAGSKEEYANLQTLEYRLTVVAKQMNMKKAAVQQGQARLGGSPGGSGSSSPVGVGMIPTPGTAAFTGGAFGQTGGLVASSLNPIAAGLAHMGGPASGGGQRGFGGTSGSFGNAVGAYSGANGTLGGHSQKAVANNGVSMPLGPVGGILSNGSLPNGLSAGLGGGGYPAGSPSAQQLQQHGKLTLQHRQQQQAAAVAAAAAARQHNQMRLVASGAVPLNHLSASSAIGLGNGGLVEQQPSIMVPVSQSISGQPSSQQGLGDADAFGEGNEESFSQSQTDLLRVQNGLKGQEKLLGSQQQAGPGGSLRTPSMPPGGRGSTDPLQMRHAVQQRQLLARHKEEQARLADSQAQAQSQLADIHSKLSDKNQDHTAQGNGVHSQNTRSLSGSLGEGGNAQGAQPVDEARKLQHARQQRWLLLLRHASRCTLPEGQCPSTPHCHTARTLYHHIMQCRDPHCQFDARCRPSQALLKHHRECRDSSCPVCGPVRQLLNGRQQQLRMLQQQQQAARQAYQESRAGPMRDGAQAGLQGDGAVGRMIPVPGQETLAQGAGLDDPIQLSNEEATLGQDGTEVKMGVAEQQAQKRQLQNGLQGAGMMPGVGTGVTGPQDVVLPPAKRPKVEATGVGQGGPTPMAIDGPQGLVGKQKQAQQPKGGAQPQPKAMPGAAAQQKQRRGPPLVPSQVKGVKQAPMPQLKQASSPREGTPQMNQPLKPQPLQGVLPAGQRPQQKASPPHSQLPKGQGTVIRVKQEGVKAESPVPGGGADTAGPSFRVKYEKSPGPEVKREGAGTKPDVKAEGTDNNGQVKMEGVSRAGPVQQLKAEHRAASPAPGGRQAAGGASPVKGEGSRGVLQKQGSGGSFGAADSGPQKLVLKQSPSPAKGAAVPTPAASGAGVKSEGAGTSQGETKVQKLHVQGVSLTELFTVEEIKAHKRSLRQGFGANPKKAQTLPGGGLSTGDTCPLCLGERLTFEPPPLYCTACGTRIKRNAPYYAKAAGAETKHFFCTQCHTEARGDTMELDGQVFPKSRLEKRKNDEETEEAWVACDKCENWTHQVCALFNGRRNDADNAEYTCPDCLQQGLERGERQPLPSTAVLMAKDLPTTQLSTFLERRLAAKLQQERKDRAAALGKRPQEVETAEGLVIRVVSSVDKKLEVKHKFLEVFGEQNYPTEYPYKSKVVLLFQRIEGVEVLLYGMYTQEFGAEAGQPNSRRLYLSYLDSVKYFRPEVKTVTGEALRTFVYHEILIGYLHYTKARGFTSVYIWACPPLKGEDYILYCHPEIQKTPKSDKLREWYLSMLRKAQREGIVVETVNLYDNFFVDGWPNGESRAKVTAARLPYFDGDYWPGAAEDMLAQLEEEAKAAQSSKTKKGNKKTKMASKSRGPSKTVDLSEPLTNAAKDMYLMKKLGDAIKAMKEDFIMVHMQPTCSHCREFIISGRLWRCQDCKNGSFKLCDACYTFESTNEDWERHPKNEVDIHTLVPEPAPKVPADTRDRDDIMESEFFDTRQAFLSLCQGNHYQYDTLRRAKHSSMMVLYHLHNPSAPAFVSTCNICQQDIEPGKGWRCEVCPDFDVCANCKESGKLQMHPGGHKFSQDAKNVDRNEQTVAARDNRLAQLRALMGTLLHATQCREKAANCKFPKCTSMRLLFRHAMVCQVRANGGCHHCKKMWVLLQFHARMCKEPNCAVPRCKDLREHMLRQQQQAETRRRNAVNEMMRLRAAEQEAEGR